MAKLIAPDLLLELIKKNDYRDQIRTIYDYFEMKQADLAKISRIERSLVSKIFSKKAHLAKDNLVLFICTLLKDSRYVDLVLSTYDLNRASFEINRKIQGQKLIVIKEEIYSKIHSNLNDAKLEDQNFTRYFSSPLNNIIHMLLLINKTTNDNFWSVLVNKFNLSKLKIIEVLTLLVDLELATSDNEIFSIVKNSIHLPPDHPMADSFHLALRSFSQSYKVGRTHKNESKSITATVALSNTDFNELMVMVNEFVLNCQQKVIGSSPEVLGQFNVDFFKYT